MSQNYLSKTPTLQSLQDGSGRESGHIVLAGEKKFLFLLLGSLSDFGINHYKKYKVQFTRYMLLAFIYVVLCSLYLISLGVCLARRRTTQFVVNHEVDAKGTASID